MQKQVRIGFAAFYERVLTAPTRWMRASLVARMVKHLPAMQETWVWSLHREDPLEKAMATHSSILPGESRGQRSLVGYSPWGCKQLDRTEQISKHTHTPTSFPPAYPECGFLERSLKMISISHPSVYPFYLKTFPIWQMKKYFLKIIWRTNSTELLGNPSCFVCNITNGH